MEKRSYKEDEVVACINCITEKTEELTFHHGSITNITETERSANNISFVGPGLIDLQVNGINGIDFNTPSLTQKDIVNATDYLLSQGVTSFLPTVVTNSDENILKIVHTIYEACRSNPIVNECIWGIHLEGPFISPVEGAKGAHDKKYIKAPDWELFKTFQAAAGGKIKLITIAPEWEGSRWFLQKCKDDRILVSIGHSMANTEQIRMAVEAGASLSTHLGNGVPLLLPRHPNLIWDQLAAEELYACIITDGIHIPDSFIKVVIKNKAKKTIVISDATCFAGMAPGEYQNHIGGTVVLNKEKRVSLKGSPGLLAGAAKSLLENVETLISHNLSTLSESWQMASANAADMLAKNDDTFNSKNDDLVIFQLNGKAIEIERVIKNRRTVFEKGNFEQMKLQP
jgi:N-acetylglucosamine-6-phosphate deacetylase